MGLGPKENPRDHFSNIELDTNTFIDALTAHKVRAENTWGMTQATNVGHSVGKQVGRMFDQLMGDAPISA